MTLYRKRPVIVEAFRWMPEIRTMDDEHPVPDWLVKNCVISGDCIEIYTLEGVMRASPGDWIVREGASEKVYPVKPEIFEATYESVV